MRGSVYNGHPYYLQVEQVVQDIQPVAGTVSIVAHAALPGSDAGRRSRGGRVDGAESGGGGSKRVVGA